MNKKMLIPIALILFLSLGIGAADILEIENPIIEDNETQISTENNTPNTITEDNSTNIDYNSTGKVRVTSTQTQEEQLTDDSGLSEEEKRELINDPAKSRAYLESKGTRQETLIVDGQKVRIKAPVPHPDVELSGY